MNLLIKPLETERLILRPWTELDFEDFYEYARNPRVGPNAGWRPHVDREDSKDILRLFIEGDETWAIVEKASCKAVGSISLHRDKKRTADGVRMLGYVLNPDFWNRGYMTEAGGRVLKYAFEEVGLRLVSVYHYPFNRRSKRVIEKLGFIYEGILRHSTRSYEGSMFDDVCYSLTDAEYFSR